MNFGPLARAYGGAIIESRLSPIPTPALLVTFTLAITALTASLATGFVYSSLPNNILLFVAGVVAIDVGSRFAPQSLPVEALRTINYGLLYLMTTILYGIVAVYALQRFAFPMQDQFLADADAALGLNWVDFARWVDRHPPAQRILDLAYHTIALQVAAPAIVLACVHRPTEVRAYLLAFAIAFMVTIFVSAVMPAAGPVAFVDRASFEILRFTGATPLDHLLLLREPGPLVFTDRPGGIVTFPSFHATVAILTPLALRRYPVIFVPFLVLNAAMLVGTLSEVAHYFIDVLAGGALAVFAHWLAGHVLARPPANRDRAALPAIRCFAMKKIRALAGLPIR